MQGDYFSAGYQFGYSLGLTNYTSMPGLGGHGPFYGHGGMTYGYACMSGINLKSNFSVRTLPYALYHAELRVRVFGCVMLLLLLLLLLAAPFAVQYAWINGNEIDDFPWELPIYNALAGAVERYRSGARSASGHSA